MNLVQSTGDAIKGVLDAAGLGCAVWRWAPAPGLSQLPAVLIMVPEVERVGVDEGESQLGSYDWRMSFPLLVIADLTADVQTAQEKLVALVAGVIEAFDADSQLNTTSVFASVVSAVPTTEMADQARSLIGYELTLDVLRFSGV